MTREEIDRKLLQYEADLVGFRSPWRKPYWPKNLSSAEKLVYDYFLESFTPLLSWIRLMGNQPEFEQKYHHKGINYFKKVKCLPYVHEPFVIVLLDTIDTLLKLYKPYFKVNAIVACLKDMKETFNNLEYEKLDS